MMNADGTNKARATGSIAFQLLAPTLGIEADVSVRNAAGRWISVSGAGGREVTGIGPTARAAVVASLAWLGQPVMSELLADLRLFDASWRLRDVAGD